MIETLETSIEPIPFDAVIPSASGMQVVPIEPGESTVDLYRRYGEVSYACRAGTDVVAIVSSGILNTPDHVSATGGRRDDVTFEIDVEIRRFDGPIRANDPWVALIRMDLRSLDAGAYELVVRETEFRFSEMNHPERAIDPTTSERRLSFECH